MQSLRSLNQHSTLCAMLRSSIKSPMHLPPPSGGYLSIEEKHKLESPMHPLLVGDIYLSIEDKHKLESIISRAKRWSLCIQDTLSLDDICAKRENNLFIK